MIPARLRPFLLLSTLALASCAQYATVSQVRPRFRTTRAVSAPIAQVEQSFAQTYGSERSAPLQALGEYLSAADTAAQTLAANPRDDTARDAYNFAVSRVFTTFEKSKTRLDPWTQPLRVPSAKGDYLLTTPRPRREIYNPALYELTPADEFAVKGTYVKERTIKPGVGASLVAIGKQERKDAKTEYVAARTY